MNGTESNRKSRKRSSTLGTLSLPTEKTLAAGRPRNNSSDSNDPTYTSLSPATFKTQQSPSPARNKSTPISLNFSCTFTSPTSKPQRISVSNKDETTKSNHKASFVFIFTFYLHQNSSPEDDPFEKTLFYKTFITTMNSTFPREVFNPTLSVSGFIASLKYSHFALTSKLTKELITTILETTVSACEGTMTEETKPLTPHSKSPTPERRMPPKPKRERRASITSTFETTEISSSNLITKTSSSNTEEQLSSLGTRSYETTENKHYTPQNSAGISGEKPNDTASESTLPSLTAIEPGYTTEQKILLAAFVFCLVMLVASIIFMLASGAGAITFISATLARFAHAELLVGGVTASASTIGALVSLGFFEYSQHENHETPYQPLELQKKRK